MKSNQEDIDKKIERTLSSFDHIERASVNPFFYTRLKAKMETEKRGFWSLFTIPQFSMAVASVFLLLCLNFYVVINYEYNANSQADEVSTFISDYQINVGDIYELNE
ncbi:hypothetical protein QQ020_24765 [Fulvivirgaceae bacterium BMA12]|uniref:Uncharacterized protein n=1 Tax=Agaribacillus aureus TaxID=3051825 RepID=A0ABT8LEX2_9BACT|nr:hypothetical protein [Fulvivirgaceae bacterium BMA12]